jgi:hypothetical protein
MWLTIELVAEEKEEEEQSETSIKRISRKASQGFNLIPCHVVEDDAVLSSGSLKRPGHAREARVCYTLPIDGAPRLFLTWVLNFPIFLIHFCAVYDFNSWVMCERLLGGW